MEPSTKKRKIAPRPAEKPPPMDQQSHDSYKHVLPVQEAHSERSDFESFARHLQDAAMLIYSQANRSPYLSVTVLLLRWEEDERVGYEFEQLQKLFYEHFNYQTESWSIPSCSNPEEKLLLQMGQYLEYAGPDHLCIIYYTGHGFIGSDQNLYWASDTRDDAPRLKWECIRSRLENSQCDVLLLLDTCAIAEGPILGEGSLKQIIAAYPPDQAARDPGPKSFTNNLIEALQRLATGRPFTAQRLHEEIVILKQNKLLQRAGLPSDVVYNISSSNHERMPVYISLTSNHTKGILISPIGQQNLESHPGSPIISPDQDPLSARINYEQSPLTKFNSVNDLTFEEPRALVCTTFLGEPSPEMSSFKQWLQDAPVAAAKIDVEGMFHGPPTVLLISMPISVWNVLAADRTCAFLGYVNSHNMTVEYQRLINGVSPANKGNTFKDLEDGKILLEARRAAASTPIMVRHDPLSEPIRQDTSQTDPMILGTPNSIPQIYPELASLNNTDQKNQVEDSVEMHEAAEQLKALSHVRHMSHDANINERNHHLSLDESPSIRCSRDQSTSSQEPDENRDDGLYTTEHNSQIPRSKPRRSTQKNGNKQDTRCSLCSHAPFKDSSSLRKHIAAAHTRPFPCAFFFAGCTSTFGSKNEWKRHIASQHLCLTYYRCSSCPQSTVEGKGNEFNRKDLFTQHLRRMHAPFAIKKSLSKDDTKLQLEWESHVKEMQSSCLVIRRQPPQKSACPNPECSSIFEGAGSWDDWTEHVGRHLEKGEAHRLGVDRLLAKWALDEGIIERRFDGEYRLVGSDRDVNMSSGYHSDGNGGVRSKRIVSNTENGPSKIETEKKL